MISFLSLMDLRLIKILFCQLLSDANYDCEPFVSIFGFCWYGWVQCFNNNMKDRVNFILIFKITDCNNLQCTHAYTRIFLPHFYMLHNLSLIWWGLSRYQNYIAHCVLLLKLRHTFTNGSAGQYCKLIILDENAWVLMNFATDIFSVGWNILSNS